MNRRQWRKAMRVPRLRPGESMRTGVVYYAHFDGDPNCLCPYCPNPIERLEREIYG